MQYLIRIVALVISVAALIPMPGAPPDRREGGISANRSANKKGARRRPSSILDSYVCVSPTAPAWKLQPSFPSGT